MTDRTPEQALAYAAAVAKLKGYADTVSDRDELIHSAHQSGVPKAEIARRMGISRDTVIRVLGSDDEEG
jgi:DNA invertase Pin-like site-specific DNA recombinase